MSLTLKEALERDVAPTDTEITPELQRAALLWARMVLDADAGLLARRDAEWVRDAIRGGTLSVHQTRSVLSLMRSATGLVRGAAIHDGTYTVVLGDGERRTIRLRTQGRDARFAPGRQIASFLVGADNTRDYVGFGFVGTDGALTLWARFARETTLAECMRVLLGDPMAAAKAYGLASGRCAICGRELTVPESIERGIGPECAGRL